MKSDGALDEMARPKLMRLVSSLEPVRSDLSLVQLLALCSIALEPGLSVNELAERLACPQQTASRHVAALLGRYQGHTDNLTDTIPERSKLDPLIVQEISQSDPRRRALFLSEHGRALIERVLTKLGA